MLATLSVALALTSPAFHAGGTIPSLYTCAGADVSPPLRWTAPPRGTRSLALSVTDPDAGGFVHWRAWGIAASTRALASGARPPHEGRNGFGRVGYGGPCPPPGPAHHYVFELRALDARGRVLATGRLVGLFGR